MTQRNKDGSKSYARDIRNCKTCGVEFAARRRYGAETPTHYCSRTCQPAYNKEPVGTRTTDSRGYVVVKTGSGRYGWRREHVLIAERALGRNLKRGEVVHHINGVKGDNRNENLLICTASYHRELHERMAHLYQQEHFA